jgi:predicted RNA methylase
MKYSYRRIDQRLNDIQTMINDKERNIFYKKLLERHVVDKNVIDVGFGSGILSIMAIKLGAKKVVAYEQDYELAEFGKKIIQQLNLEDKIEIVNERFNTFHLRGDEDVLIHEIFSEDLFGEYLYYSLKDCPIPIVPNIYKCEVFIREATDKESMYFNRNAAIPHPIYFFDPGVLDDNDVQSKTLLIENEIYNLTPEIPITLLEKNKIDNNKLYVKLFDYTIDTNIEDFPKSINRKLNIASAGNYVLKFKYSFGDETEMFCTTDEYEGKSWDQFKECGNPIGLHITDKELNFYQSIVNGKYIFTT